MQQNELFHTDIIGKHYFKGWTNRVSVNCGVLTSDGPDVEFLYYLVEQFLSGQDIYNSSHVIDTLGVVDYILIRGRQVHPRKIFEQPEDDHHKLNGFVFSQKVFVTGELQDTFFSTNIFVQ